MIKELMPIHNIANGGVSSKYSFIASFKFLFWQVGTNIANHHLVYWAQSPFSPSSVLRGNAFIHL